MLASAGQVTAQGLALQQDLLAVLLALQFGAHEYRLQEITDPVGLLPGEAIALN